MTESSTASPREGPTHLLWHACGVVLVILVPTLARLGLPFWAIQERLVPQVTALAVGYLGTALFVARMRGKMSLVSAFGVLAAGVVAFAASIVLLVYLPGFDYSRLVILTGVVVGLPIAAGPFFLPTSGRRSALGALLVATVAVGGWSAWVTARLPTLVTVESRDRSTALMGTALHNLKIDVHRNLFPSMGSLGGGIVSYRGEFLVADAVGAIFRVRRNENAFESQLLAVSVPMDWEGFVADNTLSIEARHFRVMDLLVDSMSVPHRLLVSHYRWDRDARCVAMRISAIPVPTGGSGEGVGEGFWETLFTSRPCIPIENATATTGLTNHGGGRMAWSAEGDLLYTVGDFMQDGTDGRPNYAQMTDNDYGKVLKIDSDGTAEIFSSGHRNGEGLFVTGEGTIWETEHGPTGGDELNLLMEGANYGWADVSYGTETGVLIWGLTDVSQNHGSYEEPRFTWIPSVGISHLIELGGKQFPAWEGDLLAASLAAQSLFRIRVRDGRVVYVERIVIGGRIRDLIEDSEGRILLWMDDAYLVTIENGGNDRTGEIVFAQCASCHESAGRDDAIGPDLRGLYGRWAGTVPGYDYSPAFEEIELRWSPETLNRFLENPAAVIPGTQMPFPGLPEEDRRAVVEYLSRYE